MRGPIYTKRRADAPDGFFDAEAAGLRWLSVPGGVAVAGVHQVTRTILVIDRVNPVAASAEAADDFGRRLAVTHDAGAAWFGVGPDDGPGLGWIGEAPLALRSAATTSWGAWYAEDRLLPFARRADLTSATLDRVIERLAAGTFERRGPPRLGCTAICGRATCSGRRTASYSSTRPRTAATGSPIWRCWNCSERPSWGGCTRRTKRRPSGCRTSGAP